jgi:hypothetical protein
LSATRSEAFSPGRLHLLVDVDVLAVDEADLARVRLTQEDDDGLVAIVPRA